MNGALSAAISISCFCEISQIVLYLLIKKSFANFLLDGFFEKRSAFGSLSIQVSPTVKSEFKKPESSQPSHCSKEYCADPDNLDAFYWEDEDSRGLSCGTCHETISSETYNEDKSIEYYMKEFKN